MVDKLEIKVSFARQSAVRTNRIAEFEPANLHPQKPAAHTHTHLHESSLCAHLVCQHGQM